MKLSKNQIIALAQKITKELNTDIENHNKNVREKKDKLFKQILKKEPLFLEFINTDVYGNHSAKIFLEKKFKEEFDKFPVIISINQSNIENELIILSIEHVKLDELIEHIKNKFTKI